MAAATFGELLGPARKHLDAAAASTAELRGRSAIVAARVVSRIAWTLSRYLDDVAPYGVAEVVGGGGLDGRAQAVVDAGEALRMAASLRVLGSLDARSAEGPADPAVAHLKVASEALTAGRDLLRTHVGTDADGWWTARSDWAAVVGSVPVTRALMEEVAHWSRQLAFLTARLFPGAAGDRAVPEPGQHALAGACRWLLAASAALAAGQRWNPATPADAALLRAIPVNVIPPGRALAAGETVTELAEGVAVSAARLRAIAWATAGQAAWSPAMTADSWQWTATGAAVICHLSGRMLGSFAEQPELEESLPGAQARMRAVAETVAGACAGWRTVAAAWSGTVTETRGLTAPIIADAGDLVVRVGRLVSGDPDWAPDAGRVAGVREVAVSRAQFKVVVGALHCALDVLDRLGAADLGAVGTALQRRRMYVLTRTLPESYDVPYRFAPAIPADARALVGAYKTACRATRRALAGMDRLAAAVGAPSQTLAAARSAARSSADLHRALGAGAAVPDTPARRREAAVVPEGPVAQAVRRLRGLDPVLLLRATAIDMAANALIEEAKDASRPGSSSPAASAAGSQAQVASMNFPPNAASAAVGCPPDGSPTRGAAAVRKISNSARPHLERR